MAAKLCPILPAPHSGFPGAHLAHMALVIQEAEPWERLQRTNLLIVNEIPGRCSIYLEAADKVGVNSTIKYIYDPFLQHTARAVHYT